MQAWHRYELTRAVVTAARYASFAIVVRLSIFIALTYA